MLPDKTIQLKVISLAFLGVFHKNLIHYARLRLEKGALSVSTAVSNSFIVSAVLNYLSTNSTLKFFF